MTPHLSEPCSGYPGLCSRESTLHASESFQRLAITLNTPWFVTPSFHPASPTSERSVSHPLTSYPEPDVCSIYPTTHQSFQNHLPSWSIPPWSEHSDQGTPILALADDGIQLPMVTLSPSASQPLHLKQTFLSDHPLSFLLGLVGINSLLFAEYAALSLECRRGTSKVMRALQH